VDDAALVRIGEAVGHLLGDIDRFDDRDRALQHLSAELDSLEKLHRHVGEVALLAEIVDGDDIGMGELARGLGFEEEPLVEFLAPFTSSERMMVFSATVRSRAGSSAP